MDETDEVRPLLDRLQAGDQQALGELFSRYRDRLGRMIQFRLDGRLKGRVAASDVLQEAYIDALKRLPHYQADPDMPFLIWLRWVTMQRLVEVHRQHLGAQMRDAGREVALDGGGPLAASSAMIAEFVGDLTSPRRSPSSGGHWKAWTRPIARCWPSGTSRN
jgi:RNA polymerase sigma-70 factor, ECF subfamily